MRFMPVTGEFMKPLTPLLMKWTEIWLDRDHRAYVCCHFIAARRKRKRSTWSSEGSKVAVRESRYKNGERHCVRIVREGEKLKAEQ